MSQNASSQPAPVPLRSLGRGRVQGAITTPAPATLPQPLTSLIGRDADVAAACALLAEGNVRLLTLTGPSGVGKTRLALRIAEETASVFTDGAVFIPLAAITDPDLVLPTIARTLGLREDATRSPLELLADSLRSKQLLLVLDNFEQVRPAATQLATLLTDCPDVAILVTSRAILHVAGEQRFPVAPLALPAPADGLGDIPYAAIAASPAVQLFVARAQAVEPRFALDAANAAVIGTICRRLDGLPLAIELAAARTRLLSPAELLARLEPALPILTGGPDDAPDRLRTMRHAIAWSYHLLSPEEQTLFRRLAIFVGGFTLDAAESVGREGESLRSAQRPALPPSILDGIEALVDKSLLRRGETGGQTRFAMLETIREFGLERLTESGEAEEIAARHATWCMDLADDVRRSGRLSHRQGLALLEAEHPNLRAALAWHLDHGETTGALHLAGNLAEFWLRHSHLREGRAWLERALAADNGPPTAARAEALVGLNMMLWSRSEWAQAAELLDEAETVARAADDAGALAYARLHQGYVALFAGDLDRAVARGEEALTTCAAIPQGFSCNGAHWLLARATLQRGEDDQAAELYERLLAASHAAGDEISVANCLVGQAILAERRGELARAVSGFAEAATVYRGYGDALSIGHCLHVAAVIAVANDRIEPAVRLFAASDVVRTAVGAELGQSLHFGMHRHEEAMATARAALGAEGFAAAWAAGTALSLNEAIAELMSLDAAMSSAKTGQATGPAELTPREQAVLRLLVAGMTDKEIAAALGIGRRTVSNHVALILDKLGVPSRTAAAALAVRDRLI